MTVLTAWILVAVTMGNSSYGAAGVTSVIDRFATKADCVRVAAAITATRGAVVPICVQAAVVR